MSNTLFLEDFDLRKQESLKPDYLVYKTNPLLMARDEMAIMQARFFTAYLCKVDPENPNTYKVRFSLSAFCKMLDVDTSNIKKLKEDCKSIRRMGFDFTEYRRKHGEKIDPMLMDDVGLFSRFKISGNTKDGYFVEVTPTREMEHLLLNQKKYGFVSYEAQNTLCLSKKRYMRMYEFLKRSEGKGISVDIPTLKAYLGLSAEEYSDMRDFKSKILNKGIKELNKKTDIFVSYEPKKKGRGGKIVGFHFTVKRNKSVVVEPKNIVEEKKPLVLSDEDIKEFNSYKTTESEAPDLTSEDEFVEDYTINPLEKTFKDEAAKSEYIENYIDTVFEHERNKELIEFIPEEVHGYKEHRIVAIRGIVVLYLPPHTISPFDKEMWIMETLRRYAVRVWSEKKDNVKYKAYGYYLDDIERWLEKNYSNE